MLSPFPVAFFVSTLATGGAETELAHIARGLDRSRFAPRLYTLRDPGPLGESLASSGIPLAARLAPGRFPPPWVAARLAAMWRRDGIRAIYALDHTNAVVTGALAARLAGGLPLVVAIHTMGQWDRPSVPRPMRASLGGIRRIIAIAERQKEYLVAEEGLPAAKLAVIRNGIPPLDPGALPSREEARAALAIGAGEGPVVGIVAMLRPEKGHEIFLAAARVLLDAHPRALFLLVGDGPRRRELEAMAAGIGLGDRARFLGRRDDVPHVLRALDLSVLSSHPRVETLPLSQMEAMSLEIPVVATRVGAMEELITEGVEGRLAAPGDPAALAAAMTAMLADPARLHDAGRAARRKILAEFTIQRTVRETEALLCEVTRATQRDEIRP